MNNLKRVLSLALSGIMLVGMMTVGASAATFSDADDIKNTDAVNFMVALNIINGNDDGTFAPDRVVTRAEMAKMITVALNGGKDPVLGTLANPTYTDIKGHWAEKYIEYCSNLGIISGRGDGTFDPAATVTGTEAAKMMLVAMGYNSTIHNFTGADWALNVNTAANDATPNALYKGLETIDPSTGLSRENAAQLIYNGVQDDMMKRSDSLTVDDGKVSYGYEKAKDESILTEKYGYTVGYAFVTDVAFVEDDNSYDVDVTAADGTFNAKISATNDKLTATGITTKDDVSALFGQQVKVVHNADNEAVGVYAVESSVLATVTVNDLPKMDADATTAKIGGTTYRFDGTNKQAQNVPVYSFLNGEMDGVSLDALKDTEGVNKEFTIDLIDNDGNGRINCVVVHPVTVGKVTYLGKDSITISNTIGSKDLEDEINVYEGVKKNDYVIATPAANTVDNKMAIVKAETVSGTVGAVRASGEDTDKTNIRIDGTWYAVADGKLTHTTPVINDEVDLVLVNGFYAYSETSKTTSKDLLVVTALGSKQDFNNSYTAKIALMDGTTATTTIEMDEDVEGFTMDAASLLGKLFTYEKDGSTYVLTPATADNTGYDDAITSTTFDADKDRLGASSPYTYVNDDAVVFVLYNFKDTDGTEKNANTDYAAATDLGKLNKVSVISGKSLKAWDKDVSSTGKFGAVIGFSDNANGLAYAKVLVVAFDHKELPGASGDTKFGYIVAKSYQAKEGSTTYTYFDLWNGAETVTVKEKGAKKYTAGTAVSYKDLGGDEVGTVTAITDTGAVVGYSAADELINIKTTEDADTEISVTIDEDTEILYINSADKKGAEGDGIELATETAEGKFEQNVIYKLNSANTAVEAVFVDVSNKLKDKPAVGVATEEEPDEHTHTLSALTGNSEATCTTPGNKGYYTCTGTDCTEAAGTKFDSSKNKITDEDTLVIEALGHDYEKKTTADDSGDSKWDANDHVCTRCGDKHADGANVATCKVCNP